MLRGEIWLVDLPTVDNSSVQGNKRPVILVSNDMANKFSPVLSVIPLSSKLEKCKLPTHVMIGTDSGLLKPSVALCEQIITVDKTRAIRKLSQCCLKDMININKGMQVQLGLIG